MNIQHNTTHISEVRVLRGAHELPRLGQADAGQRGQVVAARHDAHAPELVELVVLDGAAHHQRQPRRLHQRARALQVHFEQDLIMVKKIEIKLHKLQVQATRKR